MRLTKDEAIALARKQLWDGDKNYDRQVGWGIAPWHYGRCELADLLTAIYGEPVIPKELHAKEI